MKSIRIKEKFRDDYISRAAGERLRTEILSAHQSGEPIELDFSGLTIASTSFFDEAIAKLAEEGWDAATVDRFVVLKDVNPFDLKVLAQVRKYRGI